MCIDDIQGRSVLQLYFCELDELDTPDLVELSEYLSKTCVPGTAIAYCGSAFGEFFIEGGTEFLESLFTPPYGFLRLTVPHHHLVVRHPFVHCLSFL